ncbi:MAG: glutaminase [Minwuia sp.]|nr:glutaminase [Minwuia sp.]
MDYAAVLKQVAEAVEPERGSGRVANYIPALAEVDPDGFGMSVVTVDGACFTVGQAEQPFSLQSVTKVMSLTLALEILGDAFWARSGREPSGDPFNSLVQLEHENGIPRNPLINAGALISTDVLISRHGRDGAVAAILEFATEMADGEPVRIDGRVAASERETGFRNAALANFIRSFGNLQNPPEDVLHVYFHQCALEMSCKGLSRAMLYLANRGVDPVSGRQVVPERRARRINAVMMTCGHYDASGDFAFHVGLPGKSGVGGGIIAIAPQQLSVAVWSPGLSPQGNSLVGSIALEKFTTLTGLSIF